MPLSWFRRRPGRPDDRDDPPGAAPDEPPRLACAACGTWLGADPEDDPEGEGGAPLCGECNRARHFDVIPGR